MTTETLPNWKILESLLKRDWWESELACRIFTGFVRYDYQGSSRTRFSGDCLLDISYEDFQTGKVDISPGSPLFLNIHEELRNYQNWWKYTEHDKSPNNFRNEDEWSKEYCVRWAFIKEIDIPWLDWAIDNGYLPAGIGEAKKTKKSDAPMSNSSKEKENRLRLIGILAKMLLDKDVTKHLPFREQALLICYIVNNYGDQRYNKGLAKGTLDGIFGAANKYLKSEDEI
jgi:hypothetical protein